MKNEVLGKLKKELTKSIKTESQVVYILSCIRKILEIEDTKKRYNVINFYCNWALHSNISNTEPIGKILKDFIVNREERYKLIFHQEFKKQLYKFLECHDLPVLKPNRFSIFKNLLNLVVSDTPLDVSIGKKYRITLGDPKLANLNYSIVLLENATPGVPVW